MGCWKGLNPEKYLGYLYCRNNHTLTPNRTTSEKAYYTVVCEPEQPEDFGFTLATPSPDESVIIVPP
ncbi:MAG: hypothetical protein KC592_18885 [Nitrospira sp.]|nr:hypothetical protein [Nitrospira sp.]HNP31341.1 hypothetical protein [Nitrospirales bacterium]